MCLSMHMNPFSRNVPGIFLDVDHPLAIKRKPRCSKSSSLISVKISICQNIQLTSFILIL